MHLYATDASMGYELTIPMKGATLEIEFDSMKEFEERMEAIDMNRIQKAVGGATTRKGTGRRMGSTSAKKTGGSTSRKKTAKSSTSKRSTGKRTATAAKGGAKSSSGRVKSTRGKSTKGRSKNKT